MAPDAADPGPTVDLETSLLREPRLRQTSIDFVLSSLALALEPNRKKAR